MVKKIVFIAIIFCSYSFSAMQSSWHFGASYPFSLNLGFQSLYSGGIPWLQMLARCDFHFFPAIIRDRDTIKLISFALTPGLATSIPLNSKIIFTPKIGINAGLLLPITKQSEPLDLSLGTYLGTEVEINNNIILGLSFYNLFSNAFLGRWITFNLGFLIKR
jgi:hypothetical protein